MQLGGVTTLVAACEERHGLTGLSGKGRLVFPAMNIGGKKDLVNLEYLKTFFIVWHP